MELNFIGDDYGPLFHYQYRFILIGDSTVGKSSLLKYFTEGKSAEITDPTVGVDFYARMIELRPNFRVETSVVGHSRPRKVQVNLFVELCVN